MHNLTNTNANDIDREKTMTPRVNNIYITIYGMHHVCTMHYYTLEKLICNKTAVRGIFQ